MALGVALSSGCASLPEVPVAWPESAVRGEVSTARGERLPVEATLQMLSSAKVVLVGEQHGDPSSHATQREVIEALVALHGAEAVVVAVEWWPASARLAIAGWLASSESVRALAEATRWDEVWGHPLASYAPLLERIRSLGVKLIPINAEPGLARLVARGGPDAVPAERRGELPPLDSATDAHRQWFYARMRSLMEAHGAHAHGPLDPARLERMYLAQLVWDETMARAVDGLARDHVVVVLAGEGHVVPFAIPSRLAAKPAVIIVTCGEGRDALSPGMFAWCPQITP